MAEKSKETRKTASRRIVDVVDAILRRHGVALKRATLIEEVAEATGHRTSNALMASRDPLRLEVGKDPDEEMGIDPDAPIKIKIQVGSVTHPHGVTWFAGVSPKGLDESIQKYCARWWPAAARISDARRAAEGLDPIDPKTSPADEMAQAYFEAREEYANEELATGEVEVTTTLRELGIEEAPRRKQNPPPSPPSAAIVETEPTRLAIQIATISHGHGTDVLLATTEEGIQKKIAEYCADNWHSIMHEEGVDGREFEEFGTDEAGDLYFEKMGGEESIERGVIFVDIDPDAARTIGASGKGPHNRRASDAERVAVNVECATITHHHGGESVIVALDVEALEAEIAEYCRTNWPDIAWRLEDGPDGWTDPETLDDKKVAAIYFEYNTRESWDKNSAILWVTRGWLREKAEGKTSS